jgi:hypothetical protein
LDSETQERELSRRDLLKTIGVGAAVAWSAPILTSLGAKALAGEEKAWRKRCQAPCDSITLCALTRPGDVDGLCGCSADTEGDCVCWANCFCADLDACTSKADCPAGYNCIPGTGCGAGGFCLPACGKTCIGDARSGPRPLNLP